MAVSVVTAFNPTARFFDLNLKFLFYVGLWPGENRSLTFLQFYKVYEITLSVSSLILFIMTGIGTYMNSGVLTTFLADIDKTCASSSYILKVILFFLKREQVMELVAQILNSGDKVDKKRERLITAHVILITGLMTLIAMLFQALALKKGELLTNAWFPFDPMKNELTLVAASQILGILFIPCAYRAMAIQGILGSIIIYLCDQLNQLQYRLKAMDYSVENEIAMRQEFKDIIKKHIRLMGYSNTLKSIFKEYFFVQSLQVTTEMCISAVMVTIVGFEEMNHMVTFILYLCTAMFFIYIFCHLGNELMDQSSGIAVTLYELNWTSWPVDLQKDLLIMMTIAQKSFELSAGGIANMSKKTYAQILKQGYSVFTIIRDVLD